MSLSVANLNFSYARRPILQAVNFAGIPRGKLTALIGPNAAGKSTLFRCLAGLLKATHDAIRLEDQDLELLSRSQRSQIVCYMPQNFLSNTVLTVFEVVLLARKQLQGWRVDDNDIIAVDHLLVRLGIEHLAETYIGELSGGQQQLVSIAQALVRTPQLFLLDEPTSALDLRHQLEVMSTIQAVTAERDIATIVALHDLNLAARFAEHLLLMGDGRIVAAGPPEQLLAAPAVSQTYGINIELAHTTSGALVVAASL